MKTKVESKSAARKSAPAAAAAPVPVARPAPPPELAEQATRLAASFGESLKATGAFPPVVVRIFSVGQQSGRLEEMLDRLAVDYDRQVTTASQRLTAVLEPVLILVLVVLVGFIGVATILPLLEAADVF